MKAGSFFVGAALIGGAMLQSAASAQHSQQSRVEATVYRDAGYRGPAMAVSQAQANTGLAWPVTSVRVARGTWQLCSDTNFRGTCVTIDRDQPNFAGKLGRTSRLASIRPINPGGGGGGGGGAGGSGKSLRGMAAEFYPDPAVRGQRVLACARGSATANCAATSADVFCRNAGWTASARESMETVEHRVYLADVLCSRTGR
jgi:hypothetical protein